MRHNVVLLLSSVIFLLLSIHAYSKPVQEDSSANNAEVEYENGLDLLRRITRQAAPGGGGGNANNKLCKYKKGAWSACDPQTKFRTRTFTLKRGDAAVCEEQKTIRKECKGKKEGGKKNKSRDRENGGGNQQGKNRERADRPRKKNNHNNN